MKITTLLEDLDARSRYLAQKREQRSDLGDAVTPFQTGLLKRIASGKLDPISQTLNHHTYQALDGLIALGLLDEVYGLTPSGEKFVKNTNKVVSPDLQDAQARLAARKAMKRDVQIPTDEFTDEVEGDEDDMDDEDADDDAINGTVRVAKSRSKVNPLKSDDFNSFDKDDMGDIDDEGEYKWD